MMCAIEEPQVCFLTDEENRRLCFSFLSLKHISTALRDLGLHVLNSQTRWYSTD